MTKRKAYKLKAGNLKNLRLVTEDLPAPGANEVTVAVRSIGLNFADIFALFGLYSATPKGTFVPGLEYAGEIIAAGEGVRKVKTGDKIMGVTRFGAYTTHLNIDERYVIPLPEEWDYETGAAYLVQGLTAYYGLFHLGQLQENQTVLIHSAAGGVGLLANRMAKKYNAFTIGTVGSSRKIELLEKEGYNCSIVRSKDFAKDLQKCSQGREINLVMECIGGDIFKISFEHLAPQGRVIVYGAAQYASTGNRPNYFRLLYKYLTRPRIDAQQLAELNKGVLGFNLIYLYEKAELMHQLLAEMAALKIDKPLVGHSFFFDKLPEAIKLFQSGQTTGKVVVRI